MKVWIYGGRFFEIEWSIGNNVIELLIVATIGAECFAGLLTKGRKLNFFKETEEKLKIYALKVYEMI